MADQSANAVSSGHALIPSTKWAQRKDKLYVTISVENCTNPVIKFEDSSLFFSGTGGAENKDYELRLGFYGDIVPSESKYAVGGREINCVIKKKESAYWPRLLKDTKKAHFLKTDFERWRDEADSDIDAPDDYSLDDMMNNMGGLDSMDDVKEDADSDDEDLPDLTSS